MRKGARVQGCKLCNKGALHPWGWAETKGAMQCTYYVGATAFAPIRLSQAQNPTAPRMAAIR